MTTNNTKSNSEITNNVDGGAAVSGRPSVYDIITDRIIAQLENQVIPWHKPWKGGTTGAPKNLKSGQPYRGINVFLLGMAPFAAPYWLTYRQATERGGSVKKGEHGYPVVFWKIFERTEKDDNNNERIKRLPCLRYYTLFNVEQCTGIEAPTTPAVVSDFHPIEKCEAVVAGMPQAPTITHNEGRAYCRPSTDAVSIPRPELFSDPAEYYCTLYHELSHATGHASRLDRPGITEAHFFGTCDYSKEELIAEMGAAFLCGHCGIESTTLDNSAAYLSGWLKRLRADSHLIITAAAQAQRAADFILDRKADHTEPATDAA